VLILVASILQTGVGAMRIAQPDITPNLLLILLAFFAFRADPTDAIITSFAIGLAADLSHPTASRLMGPWIISYGLFGTLLSDLSGTLSPRRLSYQAATLFLLGFLTAGLAYLLTMLRADRLVAHLTAELFWQPLYSAVLGPLLFWPIGWWMRMHGRGARRLARKPLWR